MWYDVIWYDMIWYDVMRYDLYCTVLYCTHNNFPPKNQHLQKARFGALVIWSSQATPTPTKRTPASNATRVLVPIPTWGETHHALNQEPKTSIDWREMTATCSKKCLLGAFTFGRTSYGLLLWIPHFCCPYIPSLLVPTSPGSIGWLDSENCMCTTTIPQQNRNIIWNMPQSPHEQTITVYSCCFDPPTVISYGTFLLPSSSFSPWRFRSTFPAWFVGTPVVGWIMLNQPPLGLLKKKLYPDVWILIWLLRFLDPDFGWLNPPFSDSQVVAPPLFLGSQHHPSPSHLVHRPVWLRRSQLPRELQPLRGITLSAAHICHSEKGGFIGSDSDDFWCPDPNLRWLDSPCCWQ